MPKVKGPLLEPARGCIPLPCSRGELCHFTPFPFRDDSSTKACLVLSSGQLVVRKHNGACLVVDVAQAMWDSGYRDYFSGILSEWRERRPWLALPWREAGVTVRVMVKDPPGASAQEKARSWQGDVGIAFVWEDLVPQRIKDGELGYVVYVVCHSAVKSQWIERSLQLPFANLLLGVKRHARMARTRQYMIAFMLSTHQRVGRDSLIGSLTPEILRNILELAGPLGGVIPRVIAFMLSTHQRVGRDSLIGSLTPDLLRLILELAGLGGVIPRPDADSSLIGLNSGPQVERRDRGRRGARPPLLRPRQRAPHQTAHLPALLRLLQVFAQPVPILAQFACFGKHGG